jgi:hypothetical protein
MPILRPSTSPAQSRTEAQEPGARAFVWGVWGTLTLAAAVLVARYGTVVPVWDDYAIIPALVGEQPVTPGWLWEQCNEHRIAVPKLILLVADRLAGNDVRAGMGLSVATLSALAAALVALADRFRGGLRVSDAVFPLLLLNPGHATNLLWSIQFAFVLPTAVGTAYLIAIAGRASWPGPSAVALAGLGMAVLPLCGGTGLVFVPALAAWLFGAAWAEARSGRPGAARDAARIALAAGPGLTLSALYFRGFRKPISPESAGGLFDAARTGVQFLAGGGGMAASWAWPWSGRVTLGLIALALAVLGRAWVTAPGERPRVFGLVAFPTAMAAMAGAVGWGRGWAGEVAGFQERYLTMATPLWCWLVVVLRLYAPPALGGLIANALFATACALLWPNAEAGLSHARTADATTRALARDVRDGMPPYRVARRYTPFLYPDHDGLARFLPMLRRAGIGPFRALRDDPPFRQTRWPRTPTDTSLARWDPASSTAHVTGVDPQLTYRLPSPRPLAGIRIRYSHSNRQRSPARFQLTWKRPGQANYSHAQRYANWSLPTGVDLQTTVWIDDTVTEFRIQPDNQPSEFGIHEIVLLEPST